MKHGVFKLSIIIFLLLFIKTECSFTGYVSRGPYFSLGPIIGFSFVKTPTGRSDNFTHYNKIGHTPIGGFVGNVFYKLSKERVIGLQCCVSKTKLKNFYISTPLSMTESTVESTEVDQESPIEESEEQTANVDDNIVESGELVKNGNLTYMDLLVVFKYDFTWVRTALSFSAGVSRCDFTPSNKKMVTNLGYVLNAAMEYNINKNTILLTSVRLRHHSKKETFEAKKDGSINTLNIETGLLLSF